jgi:Clp amino terminal domain, pathogenicity island component
MTTPPETLVRLGDLIAAIDISHDDPLDRVTNAMHLAEELGDTADSLIGHFVDQARKAGASWSDIGRSMGTSKQAAQKRFVTRGRTGAAPLDSSQGFSRFRDDARAVVVTAQERAREAANDTLGVAHLVLGLVASADTTAARAIAAQKVSLQEVARTATATLPAPAAAVPELIPFDAHAKAVLEGAFAQAQRLDAESIGSEHVLLSILAAEAGTGVLAGLGVTSEAVEAFLASETNP